MSVIHSLPFSVTAGYLYSPVKKPIRGVTRIFPSLPRETSGSPLTKASYGRQVRVSNLQSPSSPSGKAILR